MRPVSGSIQEINAYGDRTRHYSDFDEIIIEAETQVESNNFELLKSYENRAASAYVSRQKSPMMNIS